MEMESRCWGIASLVTLLVISLKYCYGGIITIYVSACSCSTTEYNQGTMMFQSLK